MKRIISIACLAFSFQSMIKTSHQTRWTVSATPTQEFRKYEPTTLIASIPTPRSALPASAAPFEPSGSKSQKTTLANRSAYELSNLLKQVDTQIISISNRISTLERYIFSFQYPAQEHQRFSLQAEYDLQKEALAKALLEKAALREILRDKTQEATHQIQWFARMANDLFYQINLLPEKTKRDFASQITAINELRNAFNAEQNLEVKLSIIQSQLRLQGNLLDSAK